MLQPYPLTMVPVTMYVMLHCSQRSQLIPIQDPLNMTVPVYPSTPPEATVTYNITIDQVTNATGHNLFEMNGSTFQANYNNPILLLANQKNYSYPYDPQWNVIDFGTNSSVRIYVFNNNDSPHVSQINLGRLE